MRLNVPEILCPNLFLKSSFIKLAYAYLFLIFAAANSSLPVINNLSACSCVIFAPSIIEPSKSLSIVLSIPTSLATGFLPIINVTSNLFAPLANPGLFK